MTVEQFTEYFIHLAMADELAQVELTSGGTVTVLRRKRPSPGPVEPTAA